MTITPQPIPPERVGLPEPARSRVSYDWNSVQLGEWQNWVDLTDEDVTNEEAMKAATRVRVAAMDYANRHGLKVESRRERHGRILDLRFTRKDSE